MVVYVFIGWECLVRLCWTTISKGSLLDCEEWSKGSEKDVMLPTRGSAEMTGNERRKLMRRSIRVDSMSVWVPKLSYGHEITEQYADFMTGL